MGWLVPRLSSIKFLSIYDYCCSCFTTVYIKIIFTNSILSSQVILFLLLLMRVNFDGKVCIAIMRGESDPYSLITRCLRHLRRSGSGFQFYIRLSFKGYTLGSVGQLSFQASLVEISPIAPTVDSIWRLAKGGLLEKRFTLFTSPLHFEKHYPLKFPDSECRMFKSRRELYSKESDWIFWHAFPIELVSPFRFTIL